MDSTVEPQVVHSFADNDTVLLIDLENCPNDINLLLKHIDLYFQIIVCYAKSNASIPLDWLNSLTIAINSEKLKIIKMGTTGKNSADFGISFWAGILSATLPKQMSFLIVSDDKDLDYVVNLLKSQARQAKRIGKNDAQKNKTKAVNNEVSLEKNSKDEKSHTIKQKAIDSYITKLKSYTNNRPTKTLALMNDIKSQFRNTNGVKANEIFQNLIENKFIKLTENTISYDNEKIKNYAKQR